jgi:hypothetical protein
MPTVLKKISVKIRRVNTCRHFRTEQEYANQILSGLLTSHASQKLSSETEDQKLETILRN